MNLVQKHKQRGEVHKAVTIALAVISLVAVGTSALLYTKYRNEQNREKNAQKQLLTRVGQGVLLPGGTPSIVTVTDKTKLANASLAERVANGDTLLIYAKAKRLIVYRPAVKKVVDMLTIEDAKSTAQGPAASSPTTTTPTTTAKP